MKGPNRAGWGTTVGSFALGAAAGSAAALLLAPASGKVLRKRMGLKLKSIERTAEQKLVRARKLLARKAGAFRETAAERLEDSREWLIHRVGNHRQPIPRRVAHH
ncbi:MAG: YtxH domain-containing protein [Candidatus Omnitrophica bacterium]|nr:YtxH domain-containing protein [Candidatus Omnitrophota bacterium]